MNTLNTFVSVCGLISSCVDTSIKSNSIAKSIRLEVEGHNRNHKGSEGGREGDFQQDARCQKNFLAEKIY